MRLDACSPKDSPHWGPAQSVEEVARILCTSGRARAALSHNAEAGSRLFFLPFDHEMSPSHEYRVFVPPIAHRGPGAVPAIAAVSQYRWMEPWPDAPCPEWRALAPEDRAGRLLGGARTLLGEILAFAGDAWERLRQDGFVFDVHETKQGAVTLVELNGFGAMTGCGSALFEWIADAEALYGEREEGFAEFRVVGPKKAADQEVKRAS